MPFTVTNSSFHFILHSFFIRCAHVFCRQCILDVIDNSGILPSCPLCRGDVEVTDLINVPEKPKEEEKAADVNEEEWRSSSKVFCDTSFHIENARHPYIAYFYISTGWRIFSGQLSMSQGFELKYRFLNLARSYLCCVFLFLSIYVFTKESFRINKLYQCEYPNP